MILFIVIILSFICTGEKKKKGKLIIQCVRSSECVSSSSSRYAFDDRFGYMILRVRRDEGRRERERMVRELYCSRGVWFRGWRGGSRGEPEMMWTTNRAGFIISMMSKKRRRRRAIHRRARAIETIIYIRYSKTTVVRFTRTRAHISILPSLFCVCIPFRRARFTRRRRPRARRIKTVICFVR